MKLFSTIFVFLVLPTSLLAQIQFEDVSIIAGPFHTGESRGATWCDIDGDGYSDILASNHRRQASVYRNNRDGTFSNVTAEVDLSGVWKNNSANDTHGITCVDFDNDGDQDLLQSTGACCPPYLLVNDGGLFEDKTVALNLADDLGGQLGSWFDFNRDGLLDLTHAKLNQGVTMKQNNNHKFSPVTHTLANGSCRGGSDMGQLSDLDGDGDEELICIRTNFPSDAFKVTSPTWINIKDSLPSINLVTDSAIADFTGNLEPDFFLTRGRRVPSQAIKIGQKKVEAYLINGSGIDKGFTFSSSGTLSVVIDTNQLNEPRFFIGANGEHPVDTNAEYGKFAFELSPADPNVIGIKPHMPDLVDDRGIYIGYHPAQNEWEFLLSSAEKGIRVYITVHSTETVTNVIEKNFEEFDNAHFPALLINNNGTFTNQRESRGFNRKLRCNSGVPGDFDNDGDVDLYIVCREGVVNLPNRVYENDGEGNFDLITANFGAKGVVGAGVNAQTGTGDVAIVSDYDNDGRLDLFVTNGVRMRPVDEGGGPDQLFRNTTVNDNKWIVLELVGAGSPNSNRDGIGAKVYITANDKTQLRQQNGKYHRWSQDDKRIHFGLGSALFVSNVTIEWPSRIVDQFYNVAANKRYFAFEGGALEAQTDNSEEPRITVANKTIMEGSGDFRFSFFLSQPVNEFVTVNFATVDATAIEGEDYIGKSGTVTFSPGQTKIVRKIVVHDDVEMEPSENFSVNLSNPQNALLENEFAIGTIIDDDGGGGGVDPCGDPNSNAALDNALFIWQDCANGRWHVRVSTGNSLTGRRFEGMLNSDKMFVDISPVNLEPSDSLLNIPQDQINYSLVTRGASVDGFNFRKSQNSNTCLNVTKLPSGAQILVGGARTALDSPFNLPDFSSCN